MIEPSDFAIALYVILVFVVFISGLFLGALFSPYRRHNAREAWHARLPFEPEWAESWGMQLASPIMIDPQ